MKKNRSRWWALILMVGTFAYYADCLGTIQNELEVLLAPYAGDTAYLIPNSILYGIFGPSMWNIWK